MSSRRSTIERLLDKTTVCENGCWKFTGAKNGDGYGYIRDCNGKMSRAHRVTYVHFKGDILPGLELDHLCRDRACVNPDHLEAVTKRVHWRRGTSAQVAAYMQNTCLKGHSLEDCYTRKDGGRECKECKRIKDAARYKRLKNARLTAVGHQG